LRGTDDKLKDGNLTGAEAIDVLDQMNQAVYASSANAATDSYACNLNGLSKLECGSSNKKQHLTPANGDPVIRSVTLAGLFAPAPWMGDDDWKLAQAGTHFYHATDFDDMAAAGLNTVVLPVPLAAWRDNKTTTKKKSKKDHHHKDDDDTVILDDLKDVLEMVRKSKLQAILQLLGDDAVDFSVPEAIQEATEFAAADRKHGDDTILAVELPSAKWIDVARLASPKTPLLVPLNLGQLPHLDTSSQSLTDDPHTFGVLDMEHTSSVADIASSTSLDDRMKMFYHESVSCMQRAPLEYAACYQNMPVLVTGLDLSIDNCALQGVVGAKFVDYGQCGRLDETTDSDWWHRHRQSFALRQLFAYEQGLGWTYPAWKLWGGGGKDNDIIDYSVLDSPAKLKSLKAVMKAGLVPSGDDWKDEALLDEACLNPPEPDFTLGDATLAPVPAPPPDCSPGWWNASIQDCTYWVPPPTDSPVACPVCEECPDTNAAAANTTTTTTTAVKTAFAAPIDPEMQLLRTNAIVGPSSRNRDTEGGTFASSHLVAAFAAGAAVALLLGSVLVWRPSSQRRRRAGYEPIPNNSSSNSNE